MKCPNCSADAADGAVECASCGVLFAKWKEKSDRERDKIQREAELKPAQELPVLDRRFALGVAATVVAIWALGLLGYFLSHPVRVKRDARNIHGGVPESMSDVAPAVKEYREASWTESSK